VGDEVLVFGAASLLAGLLLYYAVNWMFSLVSPPGTEGPSVSATDGRTRTTGHDCAICLGQASLALETNCGHIYCGDCILEVWRRSNALQATSCPYCRQRITIVLPYFSQEERDTAEVEEIEARSRLLQEVHTYNRRYSGEPRTLVETIRYWTMVHGDTWALLVQILRGLCRTAFFGLFLYCIFITDDPQAKQYLLWAFFVYNFVTNITNLLSIFF